MLGKFHNRSGRKRRAADAAETLHILRRLESLLVENTRNSSGSRPVAPMLTDDDQVDADNLRRRDSAHRAVVPLGSLENRTYYANEGSPTLRAETETPNSLYASVGPDRNSTPRKHDGVFTPKFRDIGIQVPEDEKHSTSIDSRAGAGHRRATLLSTNLDDDDDDDDLDAAEIDPRASFRI